MRIFITGAGGQLAKSISSIYLKEDLYLASRDKLDISDKDQASKLISEFKPDIIFHFASLTRGDECAKNPDMAFKINVKGTENIVRICKKNNIPLLFVSTNEVFDGRKKSAYTEKDKPNPITVAGKTKLEAENIIKENLKKYFIIRTSWLYSEWSANFLHAVLDKARKDKQIELVEDEISSPTYSTDLAKAIKKLIKTRKYGTYHLSNIGSVSRLEFANKAFEICGIKDIKIIPITLDKFKRLSKPPLFTPLNSDKAKKIQIRMPRWNNALERFLIKNKNLFI
jgi:dTDP-4-dehydrorhamnose reductase